MIVLVGKTASGKDTICNGMMDRGYKKLVTYTTRPIRQGEIPDVTYHYITKEEFEKLIEEGFFVEYTYYDVHNGERWYYGSALEDYAKADDKTIAILNPYGVKALKEKDVKNITYIYIRSNLQTIKKRLLKRGDNINEADRRISADNEDFKNLEKHVDKIVYNNDGASIDNLVNYIIKITEVKNI